MADRQSGRQRPGAPKSTTADRTSALVASGLVLMAVVGVATIFSETIAAAWWSPATPAAADTRAAPP